VTLISVNPLLPSAVLIMIGIVESLDRRCSAPQVAFSLGRADERELVRAELDMLLSECRGSYTVQGDEIIYEFPADFRHRLRKRRFEIWLTDRIVPVLFNGLRLFLGFFLVFSISLCALILLLISMRQGGGQFRSSHHPFIFYSFWERNPFLRYNYETVGVQHRDEEWISLADEVFGFIFGPHFGTSPRPSKADEWDILRSVIAKKNYKVSLQDLKPFLLRPKEEGIMARVCSGLGGIPSSTDGKQLLYTFDELRDVDACTPAGFTSNGYLEEEEWAFCEHSYNVALALGIGNALALVCLTPFVIALGRESSFGALNNQALSRGGHLRGNRMNDGVLLRQNPLVLLLLEFAYLLRWPLYIYGVLFLLIPLARYFVCVKLLNHYIRQRNQQRAKMLF